MKKYLEKSFKNKYAIEKSEKCFCFHCKKEIDKSKINWLSERGNGETGLCPECGLDTLLAQDSLEDLEFSIEFADKLYDFAFGSGKEYEKETARRIGK